MGMTMTQTLLAAHAGLEEVHAGDLIEAALDIVLGNDVTTPVAIGVFEKAGFSKVFDPEKIVIALDHYTPCKDIKSADLCKTARDFAKKHHITHLYDVGTVGIEHTTAPTVPSVLSRPVSVPPTWQPAWPPGRTGSKFPPLSKWNSAENPDRMFPGKM